MLLSVAAAAPSYAWPPGVHRGATDNSRINWTSPRRPVQALNLDLNAAISIDPTRALAREVFGSSSVSTSRSPEPRGFGTARDDSSALPELGVDGKRIRVTTKIEDFARQVHREGLPLARVWENQSMLLSVGLNPKGRPGLWIIQKVP
jgi:hypothetical protein